MFFGVYVLDVHGHIDIFKNRNSDFECRMVVKIKKIIIIQIIE